MSLWLCLRFSQLPLQALTRQAGDLTHNDAQHSDPEDSDPKNSGTPTATAVLEKQRVLQACDSATALGVKAGMGTATVRALGDNIQLLERDPAKEQLCLQQLCCWAYSISPTLYSWRDNCLLLEIGGCLTLFKGLDNLLAQVHVALSLRNYSYYIGLAATAKAAWLLSHAPQADYQQPLQEQLAPLPLQLLEDFPRQVASLTKAGLWSLGDILSLSHRALGRRCGKEFVHFLQQTLGLAYDQPPDFQPPQQFSDHYWFGYEVKANQELLSAVQLLLQSLCQFLNNTQLQSQHIEWQLYGMQRDIRKLHIHCSQPQANWREWYQLTNIKVEQLQLQAGVEGLGLYCENLSPGNARTRDLFSPAEQREPLHSLLDRLQNRLGLQSVEKIACRSEHLPEFATYSSCNAINSANHSSHHTPDGQRPFWLMPEPQPLGASANRLYWNGRLSLLEGPERIEDNWWLDAVSRDYYVARDRQGHHYWVFRDRLKDRWFIQGVFA